MDQEPGECCQISSEQSSAVGSMDENISSSLPEDSFNFFKGAVQKSVNKVTSKKRVFQHIKENFEPAYRQDSKNVMDIFKSMMDQVKKGINEEIDLQFDCNYVQQLLGDLDSLKKEVKPGQSSWRPSGDPEEDMKAHLYASKEKELEHLEKIDRALSSKNKLLNESVSRAQQRVQTSMNQLASCCNQWEETISAIPDATRQELIDISLDLPCTEMTELAS